MGGIEFRQVTHSLEGYEPDSEGEIQIRHQYVVFDHNVAGGEDGCVGAISGFHLEYKGDDHKLLECDVKLYLRDQFEDFSRVYYDIVIVLRDDTKHYMDPAASSVSVVLVSRYL